MLAIVIPRLGRKIWLRAPRVAYLLTFGLVPEEVLICHRCDNPSCVRPEHLFLGTPQQNSHDMSQKGRQRTRILPSEQYPRAKLSAEQVREIRRCLAKGERQCDLARAYGISANSLHDIAKVHTWKGVQ
jgi:hypothetical protein